MFPAKDRVKKSRTNPEEKERGERVVRMTYYPAEGTNSHPDRPSLAFGRANYTIILSCYLPLSLSLMQDESGTLMAHVQHLSQLTGVFVLCFCPIRCRTYCTLYVRKSDSTPDTATYS